MTRGRYYPKVPSSQRITALREGMRVFDRSPWGWMKRGSVVSVEGRRRQIVITQWDDGGLSVCEASCTVEKYGILCLPGPKDEADPPKGDPASCSLAGPGARG